MSPKESEAPPEMKSCFEEVEEDVEVGENRDDQEEDTAWNGRNDIPDEDGARHTAVVRRSRLSMMEIF